MVITVTSSLIYVIAALSPMIKKECEANLVIHPDEWPAYIVVRQRRNSATKLSIIQEHYVDLVSGAHTRAINRSWLKSQIRTLRKTRGTPIHMSEISVNSSHT